MLLLVDFVSVFFLKQKTAYEMRISDWSSDVCSSDLLMSLADVTAVQFVSPVFVALLSPLMLSERTPVVAWVSTLVAMTGVMIVLRPNQIGRASCRERVCQYV